MTLGEIPKVLNRFGYLGRTNWRLDTQSYTTCIPLVYSCKWWMGWIEAGKIADRLLGESQ